MNNKKNDDSDFKIFLQTLLALFVVFMLGSTLVNTAGHYLGFIPAIVIFLLIMYGFNKLLDL